MKEFEFIIHSSAGFHARSIVEFVKETRQFSSTITLSYCTKKVNAKDIGMLLTLKIPKDAKVHVCIEGKFEENEVKRLQEFCEHNL